MMYLTSFLHLKSHSDKANWTHNRSFFSSAHNETAKKIAALFTEPMSGYVLEGAEVETRLKSATERDVCLRGVFYLLLQDVSRPEEFQYTTIF